MMKINKECGNCGHEMKIHYEWFCPKCDESVVNIGTRMIYDLFKLMYHMEVNGFMSKDRYWREYVLDSYNISNDIYIDAYFSEDLDEEINRYHAEVRRILGIDNEESVIMQVSW